MARINSTPTVVAEPNAIALAAQLRWAAEHVEHIGSEAVSELMRRAAQSTIDESEQAAHQHRHVIEVVEGAQQGLATLREQHAGVERDAYALANLVRSYQRDEASSDGPVRLTSAEEEQVLDRYLAPGRAAR